MAHTNRVHIGQDGQSFPPRLPRGVGGVSLLLCEWQFAVTTEGREKMTDNAALRAISIMHERYPENLSVHEIAAEVAFSRYYFTRMFRQSTGTSPGQYLTAIRM